MGKEPKDSKFRDTRHEVEEVLLRRGKHVLAGNGPGTGGDQENPREMQTHIMGTVPRVPRTGGPDRPWLSTDCRTVGFCAHRGGRSGGLSGEQFSASLSSGAVDRFRVLVMIHWLHNLSRPCAGPALTGRVPSPAPRPQHSPL